MTTATLFPPYVTPPSVPAHPGWVRHRWTLAQYRELAKTSLFHDVKVMLIDGEIFTMVQPYPPHDTSLGLVDAYLRANCPQGHHVRNQMGFDVGTRNDPGPDLAIVPGAIRDYAKTTPTKAELIVEVSDSTLSVDITTKAELYATAGVPEYWVIDLVNRQLHVFRGPSALPKGLGASAYRSKQTFESVDSIAPLAAPNAAITVADLLP